MTTNGKMTTAVESAAAALLDDRLRVDDDSVAEALAREIVNEHLDNLTPVDAVEDGIEDGIEAAILEIDEATFAFALHAIRDRVTAEVEGQAKAIALRLLREAAARAERAAAACSPESGI
jgi:hypothetical protein